LTYTDVKDWLITNKKKAKTLYDFETLEKQEPDIPERESTRIKPWLELYSVSSKDDLSQNAKDLFTSEILRDRGDKNSHGFENLKNTVKNLRKSDDPSLHELVKIIRKNKWSKLEDFYDFLLTKWKKEREDWLENRGF
jgi:hypothetical protein